MITLASECLLFEIAGGQSVPYSADMIAVELSGDSAGQFDPEFVKQATNAVFHYFKHELGQQMITVGEFAGALEKVLRTFQLHATQAVVPPSARLGVIESDLARIADESGSGCELFFFNRLRDELRQQLQQAPKLVRFRGLRGCVKRLSGTRRWCPRCRTLHAQIVGFLRDCLSAEAASNACAILVE